MLQKQAKLNSLEIPEVLEIVLNTYPNHIYNFKKHVIVIDNASHETMGYVRLPLNISINSNLELLNDHANVLYLSISADNAAICYVEGLDIVYHTTFSSYMTRRKQGYSQIKHLNKKGKSRAGSRVRLASTIEFFENINTILMELFEEYSIDRIGLHCTPTLIPYLHQSKVSCPFDKTDERLYKIPLHIEKSNFSKLSKTIEKLQEPTLIYNEKYYGDFNDLI